MINLSDLFFEGVLDDQTFNTSGTWTRPAGVQLTADDLALIEMWGGGAGGSYGAGPQAGYGGFGGGYRRIAIPAVNLGGSTPVTIGAGGAGARNDQGSAGMIASVGGDTTVFGFSAYGGLLGTADQTAVSPRPKLYAAGRGGRSGTAAAAANTGQLSLYGGKGGDGYHQFNTQAPVRAWDGSAPGGGGGGVSGYADRPLVAGSGAAGRARIRLVRGIKDMQIWDFSE